MTEADSNEIRSLQCLLESMSEIEAVDAHQLGICLSMVARLASSVDDAKVFHHQAEAVKAAQRSAVEIDYQIEQMCARHAVFHCHMAATHCHLRWADDWMMAAALRRHAPKRVAA